MDTQVGTDRILPEAPCIRLQLRSFSTRILANRHSSEKQQPQLDVENQLGVIRKRLSNGIYVFSAHQEGFLTEKNGEQC